MTDIVLDTPGQRLGWARQRAGYATADAFARAVGMKGVTYRAYENDQNGYGKYALKFAARLGVDVEFLLAGGRPPVGAFGSRDLTTLAKLDLAQVREIDIGYAMGDGAAQPEFPSIGHRVFDREWLGAITRTDVASLFFARGEGDSMVPTLLDGDSVLIDASQRSIDRQDRIWALSYNDLGMIKRVRRVARGRLQIISDNPTIHPFEIAENEVIVVGRVVWIGRIV